MDAKWESGKRKKVQINPTKKNISNLKGINSTVIDPLSWISPGKILPTELGLPLLTGNVLQHPMAPIKEMERNLKEAEEQILHLFGEQEQEEPEEPSPIEIERQEEQKMLEALRKSRIEKERLSKTGILPPTQKLKGDEDVIDCIGTINLRTVKKPIQFQGSGDPFFQSRSVEVKKRPQSNTEFVRQQMKRVFKPGQKPFTNADTEEDFPLSALDAAQTQSAPAEQPSPPYISQLIDLREKEIYWAKGTAPFTKKEVDSLYTWANRGKRLADKKDAQAESLLKQRQYFVERTFQSRKAFEKKIELLEEECKTIRNVGPGKGGRQSTWELAAQEAKRDRSSLPFRKKQWSEFCNKMRATGGVASERSLDICKSFRNKLLHGEEVDHTMFWRIISELEDRDWTTTEAALVIETLRRQFIVTQAEVLQYLEKKEIPNLIYKMAAEQKDSATAKAEESDQTDQRFASMEKFQAWKKEQKKKMAKTL